MIGQEKLINTLNKYQTLADWPKTVLFLGDEGCGKHTLISEFLAPKFNLVDSIVEVTTAATAEDLIEYQQYPKDRIYLININNFLEKSQNMLLKFIEEPSAHAYIILLAESEIGILSTILNRCKKFKFEAYTVNQLKQIKADYEDFVYTINSTPGQLLRVDLKILLATKETCEKIVEKIQLASYSNTMSIATKINYKEEYDKLDFTLFLKTLLYVSFDNYIKTKSINSFKIYCFTAKFIQKLVIKTIAKEAFILNFLSKLYKEIH